MSIAPEDRDKLLKDYSHGMKNKMQMLVNIIAQPNILLLDEPLTSLDVVVAEEMKNTPEPVVEQPAQDTADNRVENPIDFTSLKQENPDIYAWIHVPGTDVNLPVLQSATNDFLYLDHNKDGDYAIEGAIYTEMANDTDFSDPVTVLYGHNLQNGTMFSTLHYFENEDFFNEHDTLYIYTPGHALTYRVVLGLPVRRPPYPELLQPLRSDGAPGILQLRHASGFSAG